MKCFKQQCAKNINSLIGLIFLALSFVNVYKILKMKMISLKDPGTKYLSFRWNEMNTIN